MFHFADASANAAPSGDMVFRIGSRIADERMLAFGAFCATELGGGKKRGASPHFGPGSQAPAIFNYATLSQATAKAPLLGDVWLSDIQVMAARCKEGTDEGLYIAAKGGHKAESHDHNDIGSFMVHHDGREFEACDVHYDADSRATELILDIAKA